MNNGDSTKYWSNVSLTHEEYEEMHHRMWVILCSVHREVTGNPRRQHVITDSLLSSKDVYDLLVFFIDNARAVYAREGEEKKMSCITNSKYGPSLTIKGYDRLHDIAVAAIKKGISKGIDKLAHKEVADSINCWKDLYDIIVYFANTYVPTKPTVKGEEEKMIEVFEKKASIADEHMADSILKYFEYKHLPQHLQEVSIGFYNMVMHINHTIASGPERTVAFRKLLEAKDAAVRAKLHPGG